MATPNFMGIVSGPGSNLTTTTSFVNIGGLSFNVNAGATYRFNAFLTYQASGTTAKFDPAMGGTCTATFTMYGCRVCVNGGDGTSNTEHGALLPTGSAGPSATSTALVNLWTVIDGVITVANAGTLTVVARHITAACTVQANLCKYWLEQIA